jgi:hypothetical protein
MGGEYGLAKAASQPDRDSVPDLPGCMVERAVEDVVAPESLQGGRLAQGQGAILVRVHETPAVHVGGATRQCRRRRIPRHPPENIAVQLGVPPVALQ